MSATGRNFRNFKPFETLVSPFMIACELTIQVGVDSSRREWTVSQEIRSGVKVYELYALQSVKYIAPPVPHLTV